MKNLTFKTIGKILMEVPMEQYENVLHFYRDLLLFDEIDGDFTDINCKKTIFLNGNLQLEICASPDIKESTIKLLLETNDLNQALGYFQANKTESHLKKNVAASEILHVTDYGGLRLMVMENDLKNP
ncbi:hypothetical protein VJ786_15235 [Sphingobacterium sp. PU5-4]|uniref:VOC domain-containing protein n=1 Tax=Sphingobacterium tenebrionis TaxID=3111775 RepID=A0ABU8I941_9SPHI